MQILQVFDAKDYDPSWDRIHREAVRAIIVRDGRIALVRSKKEGFYKFPGGGIEADENPLDALIRETREETGLQILADSVREFGMLWEIHRNSYTEGIFSQKSCYYYADIDDSVSALNLDDYEAALGYELVWAEIKSAYHTDKTLDENGKHTFLRREAYVLKRLMDMGL